MDAFVLPALGVLVVAFVIFVWRTWLGDPEGRALQIGMEPLDDEHEQTALDDR